MHPDDTMYHAGTANNASAGRGGGWRRHPTVHDSYGYGQPSGVISGAYREPQVTPMEWVPGHPQHHPQHQHQHLHPQPQYQRQQQHQRPQHQHPYQHQHNLHLLQQQHQPQHNRFLADDYPDGLNHPPFDGATALPQPAYAGASPSPASDDAGAFPFPPQQQQVRTEAYNLAPSTQQSGGRRRRPSESQRTPPPAAPIRSTETRFNCLHCGKPFTHSNHYKKHLDSHNGKAKSCFVCNGGYTRRDTLLRHLVDQHGYDKGAAKELIDLMEQSEAYY